MANVKINISNRASNLNPRQIRTSGFLPGSIYGKGMEAVSIQLNTHEFELLYKNNRESTWELKLDDKIYTAKIQELQVNHSTGQFLNVEFLTV